MAQCGAKTKNGTLCQVEAREGQKFCHIHLRQRNLQRFLRITALGTALGVVANITGVLGYFGLTPIKETPTATNHPLISTKTPKPCLTQPVSIPTSIPNTGPLVIAPPIPDYCEEMLELASYIAGNAVQALKEETLDGNDANLDAIFRGKALEMAKSLSLLWQLALKQYDKQDMIYDLDPLTSKVTKIELIDQQTMNLEVCMIGTGIEAYGDPLSTPMIGYMLLEMQIQKIDNKWYVMDFPNGTSPISC